MPVGQETYEPVKVYCNDCDINQTVVLSNEMTQACPNCGKPLAVQTQSFIDSEGETRLSAIEAEAPVDFDEAPQRIGKYRIISHVATGGFGSVYKGYDAMLDQSVAIKIPRKDKLDAAAEEEFIREARTMARLDHPHVVSIKEAGRDESQGSVFLVMKWIEGSTLARYVKKEPLPIEETVEIVGKIAAAVGFAHEQGFIHRDLKPSNILIDEGGEPYVTDFGLALEHKDGKFNAGNLNAGTLPYMSPEQFNSAEQDIDHRTDIWSLGVIFYQLLTGHRPFAGNATEISESIRSDDPKSLREFNARLPKKYEAACLKCLEKDPSLRFESVAAFRQKLKQKNQLTRRALIWMGPATVLGVAVWQIAAYLNRKDEPEKAITSEPSRTQRLLVGDEDSITVRPDSIVIDVKKPTLLQLGTVKEGDYVFEVEIESDNWGPHAGMFFGLSDRRALSLAMFVTQKKEVELRRIIIDRSTDTSVSIKTDLNRKRYGSMEGVDSIQFRCMFRAGILQDYGVRNVPLFRDDGKLPKLEGDAADGAYMKSNTKSCGGAFGIFARPQQRLVIRNLKINGELRKFSLTPKEN